MHPGAFSRPRPPKRTSRQGSTLVGARADQVEGNEVLTDLGEGRSSGQDWGREDVGVHRVSRQSSRARDLPFISGRVDPGECTEIGMSPRPAIDTNGSEDGIWVDESESEAYGGYSSAAAKRQRASKMGTYILQSQDEMQDWTAPSQESTNASSHFFSQSPGIEWRGHRETNNSKRVNDYSSFSDRHQRQRSELASIATLQELSPTKQPRPSILTRSSPNARHGSVTSRSSARALLASNDLLQAELDSVMTYAAKLEKASEGKIKRLQRELDQCRDRADGLEGEVDRLREAIRRRVGARDHSPSKTPVRSVFQNNGGTGEIHAAAGPIQPDEEQGEVRGIFRSERERTESSSHSAMGSNNGSPSFDDAWDNTLHRKAVPCETDTFGGDHLIMSVHAEVHTPRRDAHATAGKSSDDRSGSREGTEALASPASDDDLASLARKREDKAQRDVNADGHSISELADQIFPSRSLSPLPVGIGKMIRRKCFQMWLDLEFVGVLAWFVVQCLRMGRQRVIAAAKGRAAALPAAPTG